MKTRSETSATPAGDAAPSEGLLSQPAALDVLFEQRSPAEAEPLEPVLEARAVTVRYGAAVAVSDVSLDVHRNRVTAFIGPSGCGKTTLLRTFNRMNDLVPGAVVSGRVAYHGVDVNGAGVDPIEVRRRIGMVFQRPNPFPKSVFDNVAFGLRLHGLKDDLSGRVEAALRRAALWDEVKDRLGKNALRLSGGQQQRLCIARALAVEPDLLLMDEPASALDPISTTRIEDLLRELRSQVTIVIVTHNMQQAARVADLTAFFSVEPTGGDGHERGGVLIEYGPTEQLFTRPADRRTEDYVTGRFG